MHTPDLTQANINRIREMFPNCVTEAKDAQGAIKLAVDFDLLKQELSGQIVEGPQERYHLNWPGKREALLTANAPIAKTLRPARDESVNFDTTKNLFIEGDNLEALKLLQETYLGKIKMIYIDPPYNTGNDFIYKDNFTEDGEEFFLRSNQIDENGNRLVANTEANGRFHSDWLSMMYARIRLMRNLLSDDGVVFISIDNNEIANLKIVFDEIFGGQNLVGIFKWNKTSKAPTLSKKVRGKFEYVLCYEKGFLRELKGPDSYNEAAPLFNGGNPIREISFPPESVGFLFDDGIYPKGNYGKNDNLVILHEDLVVKNQVNSNAFRMSARYKWSQDTINKSLKEGRRLFFKTPKLTTMYYNLDIGIGKYIAPSDLLSQEECNVLRNDEGYGELKDLFDGVTLFDYVKPVSLPKYLIRTINDTSCIVLDFFAGSATTAHSVMQLNAEDGGNRKFIMVQLPEACDPKSEAFKAGYKTIADISKERIRRAGKKVLEGNVHKDWNKDIGFRVLKIDASNMADIYYVPDAVRQSDLLKSVDNIKPDRTSEDLLFQVLLDWGVDLTLPIAREKLAGKQVYFVDGNALAACFDTGISEDFVKELAARKPLRVVFRDNGFASDAVKINVGQIFKQLSPATEVKSI